MDVNETIVQAWLQTKGFFVRGRLRYDLSEGKWASVSDIDLVAYNPKTNERVAVLVTAWLTQRIAPSHIKSGGELWKKLTNFCSAQASGVLQQAFNTSADGSYRRWLVLGDYSVEAKSAIRTNFPSIDIVIPFSEVMKDLVSFVKNGNQYLPHESEALQTIRALVWAKMV